MIEDYESSQKGNNWKITGEMSKRAEKCRVNLKKQTYFESPVRTVRPSKKVAKADKSELVKKIGFIDMTQEELELKKNLKKCSIKHMLWSCNKCSGCIRPDCGKCWACKDKKKFGGEGIKRQKCQERKCWNPVVRGCLKCSWNIS